MRTSMLQTGLGRGEAMAGFSDRVELGSIGRIRSDRTVVLRVETLEGEAPHVEDAYWRGLAFDSFDGRRWSITPGGHTLRPGSVKFGISIGRGPSHPDLVQRVVREPVAGGVIFAAGLPRNVSGALLRLESDVNGGLYDPLQHDQRIRYTIETESNGRNRERLRRDHTQPPPGDPTRYLQLPELADDVRGRPAGSPTGSPPTRNAPPPSRPICAGPATTRTRRRTSIRRNSARPSSSSCWAISRATASTSPAQWWCWPARSDCPAAS